MPRARQRYSNIKKLHIAEECEYKANAISTMLINRCFWYYVSVCVLFSLFLIFFTSSRISNINWWLCFQAQYFPECVLLFSIYHFNNSIAFCFSFFIVNILSFKSIKTLTKYSNLRTSTTVRVCRCIWLFSFQLCNWH